MCVPGAMAATSAARVIRKPADAARAPDGATNTATGVLAASIRVTIVRVESTRPPGVSSTNTMSAARSASARLMASTMNSAETGWMSAFTSATRTSGAVSRGPGRGAGRQGEDAEEEETRPKRSECGTWDRLRLDYSRAPGV